MPLSVWIEWGGIMLCIVATLLVWSCLWMGHELDKRIEPAGPPVVEPAPKSGSNISAGRFRIVDETRSFLRLAPKGLAGSGIRWQPGRRYNSKPVPVLAEYVAAVEIAHGTTANGEAQDSTRPPWKWEGSKIPAAGLDLAPQAGGADGVSPKSTNRPFPEGLGNPKAVSPLTAPKPSSDL